MENDIKLIRSDSMPESIYANGISVSGSVFESRIQFLKDTIDDIKNEVTQEVVADIRLSPQLAKTLAMIIANNMQEYEKQFGILPVITPIQGIQNEK